MVRAVTSLKPNMQRRAFGVLALIAAISTAHADSAPAVTTPAPAVASSPATPPADAKPIAAGDASYLMGINFGRQLRMLGVTDEVVFEALSRGLKDGLAGRKFTPEEQRRVQDFVHASVEANVAHNLDAAQEFLQRNGQAKGVKTTASGLEYTVLAAGDQQAASPALSDQVVVNYRGTLLDGNEFDSSYSRGVPATFTVSSVIKGWQEALPMMKPGAKWRLFIPPDLAYGRRGRPEIPGGSLLIFEVQLVSVKPPATTSPVVPPVSKDPAPAQR
jgi:FKBP-type peptidyl-prolyl cis-trans isomerase